MRLAFLILAHDHPALALRLARRLLADGDWVFVHWDKNQTSDLATLARETLPETLQTRLRFAKRVAVEWGRWPMVEATLAGLAAIRDTAEDFAYVVLLSGSDYPLKPLPLLKQFLAAHPGREYIECTDPNQQTWVIQGLVHERYQHYHFLNWRTRPKLFSASVAWQKRLGIKRRMPKPLSARLGSQWWALTWPTAQQVLDLAGERRIRRFFQTTWVPDELFFQSAVAALVPPAQIAGTGLTFYHFSAQGRPLVFYNDHFEFLCQQGHFFARKLSPQADQLRAQLDDYVDQGAANAAPALLKNTARYECFSALQWRGLPGRRVVGRQQDLWYGDLEWNTKPYFVILCPAETWQEPLREAINKVSGVCCFGELFHGGVIDYGLPDRTHPYYPKQHTALRDMKRPNFLVDMLNAHPKARVGFVLRLPSGHEMEKVVIYDPQADLIVLLPNDQSEGNLPRSTEQAFAHMIMLDHLTEIRRAGKTCLTVHTQNGALSAAAIDLIADYVGKLTAARIC